MKELSLHILDIVQNSIRAKSDLIGIEITELPSDNQLIITITDNGKGMNKQELEQTVEPFYTSRTTRKVGLGLSLLRQNAEMTNGSFKIDSKHGEGTCVTAVFGFDHPDRPIVGDLTGTLLLLICSSDGMDYVFKHHTPVGDYQLDTREIRQIIGNVSISEPEIRTFLREMIKENLELIQISE